MVDLMELVVAVGRDHYESRGAGPMSLEDDFNSVHATLNNFEFAWVDKCNSWRAEREELRREIASLAVERDALKTDLTYALAAIDELRGELRRNGGRPVGWIEYNYGALARQQPPMAGQHQDGTQRPARK